jgi:uncharacterized metal-binding protein
LDGLTRSSSAPNPAAAASVATGVAALAALPAAVGLARFSERVDLVYACGAGVVVGVVLAVAAIALSRRAKERIQRTIGRSGGEGALRTGRILGILGIWAALTGALALGFFGLLELFAA